MEEKQDRSRRQYSALEKSAILSDARAVGAADAARKHGIDGGSPCARREEDAQSLFFGTRRIVEIEKRGALEAEISRSDGKSVSSDGTVRRVTGSRGLGECEVQSRAGAFYGSVQTKSVVRRGLRTDSSNKPR